MVKKQGTQQKRKKSVTSPDTVSDSIRQPEKRLNKTTKSTKSNMTDLGSPTLPLPLQQQHQFYTQGSPSYQVVQPMPLFQTPGPGNVQTPVQTYYTPQQHIPAVSQNTNIQATLEMLLQKVNNIDSRLNKLDSIEKSVESVKTKLNSIESRVTKLERGFEASEKKLVDLETSRSFDAQNCDELKKNLEEIESKLSDEKRRNEHLSTEIKSLSTETARLSEESLDSKARSMRDNLLFFNIPECVTFEERKAENCVEKIQAFCADTLKIEEARDIKIDRAHRMGGFVQNKIRPIVVKFNFFPDKVKVKQVAYNVLKNSTFRVADQFPREIKERRQVLYPIMQKARENGKRVTMSYDKLYINNRVVTADDVKARGEAVI